jgi:hypothetical protein
MDLGATTLAALKWPWQWLSALVALPRMRKEIAEMRSTGLNPLRCTACGKKLTILQITDLPGAGNTLWGEAIRLRCDTKGCLTTERVRNLPFPAETTTRRGQR